MFNEKRDIKEAVDSFSEEMLLTMYHYARAGKEGWRDWDTAYDDALNKIRAAKEEEESGDLTKAAQYLVDAANYLMMAWYRL